LYYRYAEQLLIPLSDGHNWRQNDVRVFSIEDSHRIALEHFENAYTYFAKLNHLFGLFASRRES
jgi:hypothetical protein